MFHTLYHIINNEKVIQVTLPQIMLVQHNDNLELEGWYVKL